MSFEDATAVMNVNELRKGETEQRFACFIVLAGSQAGRLYKLDSSEMTIGRGAGVAIEIEDEGVSRQHARIVRSNDGTVALMDMGSTNGTFCNGDRVDVRPLTDGDKIQIGTTTLLKFSYQDSLDEEFQRRQYDSVTRDALTSCFNRKYFQDWMSSEFAFFQRHNKSLGLAMLDIDHFKKINDTHGHQAGDYVLAKVAQVFREQIRQHDVLCRYGGEEFAVIMRQTDLAEAEAAGERLRSQIESSVITFEGTRIEVTVSLGIAVANNNLPESEELLLQRADELLYVSKGSGRNRVTVELCT